MVKDREWIVITTRTKDFGWIQRASPAPLLCIGPATAGKSGTLRAHANACGQEGPTAALDAAGPASH